MKRIVSMIFVLVIAFTTSALGQEPARELVQAGVDAINKQDVAFFEKRLADDVVWLDEDGHTIAGKTTVLNFIKRQLLTSPAKLEITNLRTSNTADAAWATYAYTLGKEGKELKRGMNTVIYKRVGADWQIAVVHGAVNAPGHH